MWLFPVQILQSSPPLPSDPGVTQTLAYFWVFPCLHLIIHKMRVMAVVCTPPRQLWWLNVLMHMRDLGQRLALGLWNHQFNLLFPVVTPLSLLSVFSWPVYFTRDSSGKHSWRGFFFFYKYSSLNLLGPGVQMLLLLSISRVIFPGTVRLSWLISFLIHLFIFS